MSGGDPRAKGEGLWDVIVVGGGAAGLSAAAVLSRAQRRVMIIDEEGPLSERVTHSHGHDSVTDPRELIASGRTEVRRSGAHLLDDTVINVHAGFTVTTAGGRVLQARQVLVATGASYPAPDLPGVRELWGTAVHTCPYCHGFDLRGQTLAVIGGMDGAVLKALLLSQWSNDVVFVYGPNEQTSIKDRLRLDTAGVRLYRGEVQELVARADGELQGVRFVDGRLFPCAAVFVGQEPQPQDHILRELGCRMTEAGMVVVDRDGRTSVPNLYAAGHVVDPFSQAESAAGDGYRAALAINLNLLEHDLRSASDVFGPAMERLVAERTGGLGRHGLGWSEGMMHF
ncbi:NAD(P)/FAD-dependent oxidoreductase [Streptomyces sp. NPDC046984]|uniref:NAD(P)/FAD-dependent oxidoreductase n=1 Tax=Streptomyces sp. NPDC046984 TaxID=3155138 RepID=UPI003405958E